MPQVLDSSVVGKNEKILIYGQPGTGKTYLSGTMPGNIYILLIGGENELKTLTSPDFLNKYPEKQGKIAFDWVKEKRGPRGKFKSADAFDQACDLLDEALELDKKGEVPEIGSFDSLVIDNMTMLNTLQMNKAIEINYGITSDKSKTTLKQLRDENIIIPGDNDWMSQMSLMTQFVDWLFNIDKHVLCVAHEWRQKSYNRSSRETTVTEYRPLFTGKHREDIPMMFDNVWRTYTSGGGRSTQYEVQTQSDSKTLAKTRFGGVIPNIMRDANLTNCIEQMVETAEELEKGGD